MDMRERFISFRFDTKTEMVEFTDDVVLTNEKTGKSWFFSKGFSSDGTSAGMFKHFDKWVYAAFPHDQDCNRATRENSYDIRCQGDKDYRDNLIYLGAPKLTVFRRYQGVRSYAFTLKLRGKLK